MFSLQECRQNGDPWITADKSEKNRFEYGVVNEEFEDKKPLTYNYDPEQVSIIHCEHSVFIFNGLFQ